MTLLLTSNFAYTVYPWGHFVASNLNIQKMMIIIAVTQVYVPGAHLLRLSSGSSSFGGAFEGQLRHYAARRLPQSEGSSRCSFFFPLFGGCIAATQHIPRFFARPKKKKEREKMATLRGVDRHFRGPGQRKS